MKKIIALVIALCMMFSLCACGSEAKVDEIIAAVDELQATVDALNGEGGEAPAGEAAAPSESYTIGIIQLLEHVALDQATQGFMDALTELLGDGVEFNFQNAQGEAANCATIANSLVSEEVDLILANATAPLQAAAAATADIPILGTSITDYATALGIPPEEWTGVSGTNISGTYDLAPLDGQAEMLAELCPVADYPTVGLVYCSAEANSIYQIGVMTQELEAMGYAVEDFSFADSNDIASVTQNACDSCDVIYIPTDNTAASNTEAINNVAGPAGIPIIAGESGLCAGCGIATLSISYYDIGYRAGEMAYDILVNGADITTMAVEGAPQFEKLFLADRAAALGIEIPEGYGEIVVE